MKCEKCGVECVENAKFCGECGHTIENETDKTEAFTTSFCNNCGARVNPEGMFCGECGASLKTLSDNVISVSADDVTIPKKKENLAPLIIILVFVIIASAGVIWYIVSRNANTDISVSGFEKTIASSENDLDIKKNVPEDESSEDNTVEKGQQEDATPQVSSKTGGLKTIAVADVDKTVLDIRAWYNDTQSNLSSFTILESDDVKKYYNAANELVRMDVEAGEGEYSRIYYLRDNKLYFAFIFNGEKENRLYFHNDTMFRWIDESKVTHDNAFSNETYMIWANYAFDEAENLIK